MPNEQTKKTLLELHKEKKAQGINKMLPVLTKTAKKKAWFYSVLKNPQSLSPIERQLFADEYGVHVDSINWNDAPVLVA